MTGGEERKAKGKGMRKWEEAGTREGTPPVLAYIL